MTPRDHIFDAVCEAVDGEDVCEILMALAAVVSCVICDQGEPACTEFHRLIVGMTKDLSTTYH
jgi:hypothetical protein